MWYSLGIMKPDCVERKLIDRVLSMIRRAGLKVVVVKMLSLTQDDIDIVYSRCKYKEFYSDMSAFLLSGDVCVYVIKGKNAINKLNMLVGETDPKLASPSTIRGELGESLRRNITHSSMNEESFWREIEIFFTQEEIKSIIFGPKVGEKC